MTTPKQDPPMRPAATSTRWHESNPNPIAATVDDAVLIARIQLASNALAAQISAANDVIQHRDVRSAARTRDLVCSLALSAAITYESMQLARENMPRLRELATIAGAPSHLLADLGRLCAGKHEAQEMLDRARNQLAFHFDRDAIKKSVQEFARNEAIVWVESDGDVPVQSFGLAILSHALFPEADTPDEAEAAARIRVAMATVQSAMHLIIEFFTAGVYGYLAVVQAAPREREAQE